MPLPPLSSFEGTTPAATKPPLSSFQKAPASQIPPAGQQQTQQPGSFPNDFFSTPAYSMGPENTSGVVGTLGKETANIAKSALKFGKGVVDFFNPINTINTIKQIPKAFSGYQSDTQSALQSEQQATALEQKAQEVTGKKPVAPPTNPQSLAPDYLKAGYQAVVPPAIQEALKGQGTKSLQSLAEDPFQLAPAFLMLKGALDVKTGGETVDENTGAPKPATRADTGVGKAIDQTISTIAKPGVKALDVAGKVAGKAGDFASTLAKFGVSQATGMSPKTIQTILENPSKFLGKDYGANYTRDAIGAKVSDAIDQRLQDLSSTGNGRGSGRSSMNISRT